MRRDHKRQRRIASRPIPTRKIDKGTTHHSRMSPIPNHPHAHPPAGIPGHLPVVIAGGADRDGQADKADHDDGDYQEDTP
jgi:hypothetical protein